MRRTHALMPLTAQEQSVKDLLLELHLPTEAHHVFEFSPKVRMSVDFLIFSGPGIIVECTLCSRGRGSAVSELRRRCAFIDSRFVLVKRFLPKAICGALVEAPKEDQSSLKDTITELLPNSDIAACSLQQFESMIKKAVAI